MSAQWRLRICIGVILLETANFVVAKITDSPTDSTINTAFTTVLGIILTEGIITGRRSKSSNGNEANQ